ncbi:hypothetical protein [uncultured Gimesia sp.]|uniref:hypothetical protein n=1 Tax=uncultured Gimesia sp. TaxID=1678688 RepID=UPI002629BB4D|nr:hypothetical protein [uncultured Gimesia sp.]
MTSINTITHSVRVLLNTTVKNIGLLVWPDEKGLKETDVNLFFELKRPGAPDTIKVFFGTEADGESPSIDYEDDYRGIGPAQPFSTFPDRLVKWINDDYSNPDGSFSPELFILSPGSDHELAKFCNLELTGALIVCYREDAPNPTGLVFEFENGKQIWSVPGICGNTVKTHISDDYSWGNPNFLERIEKGE